MLAEWLSLSIENQVVKSWRNREWKSIHEAEILTGLNLLLYTLYALDTLLSLVASVELILPMAKLKPKESQIHDPTYSTYPDHADHSSYSL